MSDYKVHISVCIPAYKRTDFLKRLFDSLAIQDYTFFETVVTDDSPDVEVEELCRQYGEKFPIRYFKNDQTLGTPANWNEVIRHAKGEWIKIMHDDDWFASADALTKFAKATRTEAGAFIFCSYYDVFLSSERERRVLPGAFRFRQMKKEPVTLLSRNIIGPPSVIMHRNDRSHLYDIKLKWLVDIEMYIRRLKGSKIVYLPEPLVKVGVSNDQVTAMVHGSPEVEVPEHFYFLQKTGTSRLKNILVYDYWWRFFRNFSLFSESDIRKFGHEGTIPWIMISMMAWQKKIPLSILKVGLLSKTLMFIHFCLFKKRIVE